MEKMVRVANIIEEGKLGGPQVRIANVACALKDRVETIVVMPVDNSERFRNKLLGCGISFKMINLSRITKELKVALRYVFISWFEIYQLVRFFRAQKFDVIHVSGGSWQYKGVLAGKISGCPVVWHLNDTCMPWILRKAFSLFSSLPDAYIYASIRSREYYSGFLKVERPGFVIPAPVDTAFFSPEAEISGDEELIEKWKGKFVIGTVANVNPIKGLDVFVKVAVALNKQIEDLVFVVVGSIEDNQQSLMSKLQEIINLNGINNIEFVGRRDDTRGILKRMDIYLCTSYAESSPISVWEAMSMAKPIVSSDVGDVARYVISGKSGEIVPVADVNEMRNRLIELIPDVSRLNKYAEASRKIAIKDLDIKYCADKHQSVYQLMASKNK